MVRPMRKTKNKKWILFAIWFVFSATFFGPGAYRAPASDGLFLKHVRIDKTILSPGEKVMISYYLSEDAQVTLLIYNPDYQVVRTLLDEQQRPAGTNTAFWDGFDGTGAMVPDEAYIFSISAKNSSGRETVYDPTAHSGGEEMDLGFDRVDEADGHYTMSYHVPVPARISIRAGVHKGPMLKNIMEWKVFLPEIIPEPGMVWMRPAGSGSWKSLTASYTSEDSGCRRTASLFREAAGIIRAIPAQRVRQLRGLGPFPLNL